MQLVDEFLFHSQSAHTFHRKHCPIDPRIVDFRKLFHEVGNDSQRVRGYVVELETARIGCHARIQAGGNLGREFHRQFLCNRIDDFAGSSCFGIQTAFLCKGAVHDVVVNRKGNPSAIGFVQVAEQFAVCDIDRENDSSVFVNGIRCFFNCQKGIAFRNRVAAPHHCMTAHLTEQGSECITAADAVAVRTLMDEDHGLLDGLQLGSCFCNVHILLLNVL